MECRWRVATKLNIDGRMPSLTCAREGFEERRVGDDFGCSTSSASTVLTFPPMASLHFRLFLALALVLGLTSHVCAQGGSSSTGVSDLPDCAQPCAKNAAAAVNCALYVSTLSSYYRVSYFTSTSTDTACLCSHSQFTSSTESCADTGNVCGVEDRSSVAGVLSAMCSSRTFLES